jgi:hypothetical protein
LDLPELETGEDLDLDLEVYEQMTSIFFDLGLENIEPEPEPTLNTCKTMNKGSPIIAQDDA